MSTNGSEFQRLDLEALAGVLQKVASGATPLDFLVGDGESEHLFRFTEHGVRMLASGLRSPPDLPSYLLANRLIDVESLERALSEARAGNGSFRAVLIRENLLSREQFNDASGLIVRDSLHELVFWREAEYRVSRGSPTVVEDALRKAPEACVDVASLATEAADWVRRWSRWRTLLHSDRAVIGLQRSEIAAIDAYEGHLEETVDLCREPSELRALWQDSSLALPELCEQLAELETLGWLQIAPPAAEPKQKPAGECIATLEASLERFHGKDLVRERLARLYLRDQRPDDAAREWMVLARGDVQRGDRERAIDRMKRVLELFPAHLEALEVIVRAYVSMGEEKRAVAVAAGHVRVLLEKGLVEEAESVTRKLHSLPGGQSEATALEAEVVRHGGRPRLGSSRRVVADSTAEPLMCSAGGTTTVEEPVGARPDERTRGASFRVASLNESGHIRPVAASVAGEASQRRSRFALPRVRPLFLLAACAVIAVAGSLALLYSSVQRTVGQPGLFGSAAAHADGENPDAGTTDGDGSTVPETPQPSDVDSTVSFDEDDGWTRRVVRDDRVIAISDDGALELRDRWSDKVLFRVPAEDDCRWAIGYQGQEVLQWWPGRRPVLWNPPSQKVRKLSWSLPADTAAVAMIDSRRLALRQGSHTILYGSAGKPTDGARLPLWTEGVLAGDLLLLQKPAVSAEDPALMWGVQIAPLRVLWKCSFESGAAMVR